MGKVSTRTTDYSEPPLILIVEDDPDNLLVLIFLLQQENYRIITATDGRSGFRLAVAKRPHLILLDIRLPVWDGYTCIKKLKRNAVTATTPVIAVTAATQPADQARIFRAGFANYIRKPYLFEHLLQAVATGLLMVQAPQPLTQIHLKPPVSEVPVNASMCQDNCRNTVTRFDSAST